MKCHRPWNENFELYFRTELRIGCCAVWVLCCSPRSRSPYLQWPQALLGFSSQKQQFCLCGWSSDQARETYVCTTMKEAEHYSAFELWLFRKHWEGWKYGNDGHRSAGSGVSRLPWGCLVHWLTWRGEQPGAQQDFGSHTCSELSLAVVTACSCVQLASTSAAFNSSTVGMRATKHDLCKERLLSEGYSLLLGSLQPQLFCAL